MSTSRPLPESFYAREALSVAVDLLGKLVRHGGVTLRITEVEAYRAPDDTANHCRFGKTARNAPMWGPAGRAYVYLCYGLHNMLNIVTDRDGVGAAVLVRACEIVDGHPHVLARRGDKRGPVLLTGPGKVGAALALDTSFSGLSLCGASPLTVLDAPPVERLLVGPRVGIDFAEERHRRAPWRLAVADTSWVSARKSLSPLTTSPQRFLDEQAIAPEEGTRKMPPSSAAHARARETPTLRRRSARRS